MHRSIHFTLAIASMMFFATLSTAEETAGDAESPKPPKITGVFESVDTFPLSAKAEQVTSLVVEKVASHGSLVRKGEGLIWFETKKVDEQIEDAEIQLRLAELTMEDDEFAFAQFLEIQQLDRKAAKAVAIRGPARLR